MDVQSLAYRTDLALLRLGGSEVDDRGDHLVIRTPHNPTYWWGNFLLLARVPAPQESQAWLDKFAAAFPDAGHLALGFDGTDGSVEDLAWFAEQGLLAEAATVMTATAVHQPAHRNGVAVYRALDTDDDWAQSVELQMRCHETGEETTAHHTFVSAKVQTNRRLVEAGHGGWFGAFLEGRLVAQMGLFAAGPGLARFQAVETDPDHRRQGLAGSLVHYVSRFGFDALGAHTLVMVADPTYFAIDLYRAVGFVPSESQLQAERPPV